MNGKNSVFLAGLVLLIFLSSLVVADEGSSGPSGTGAVVSTTIGINALNLKELNELKVRALNEKLLKIQSGEESDDYKEAWTKFSIRSAADQEKIAMKIKEFEKERLEKLTEFRLKTAARLEEKKKILEEDTDKCTKLSRRVEHALKIATEEGKTEIAAKLQTILDALNASCSGDDVSTDDDVSANDAIWDHHVERVIEKATKVIEKAEHLSQLLTRAINMMNELDGRVDLDNSVVVRLNNIQEKASALKARLDNQITLTKAQLDKVKADETPSKEDVKELHKHVIKLKVFSVHANNAVRFWVSLYNHAREDRADDEDDSSDDTTRKSSRRGFKPIAEIASAADAAVPTVTAAETEIELEAEVEVDSDYDDDSGTDDVSGVDVNDAPDDSDSRQTEGDDSQ